MITPLNFDRDALMAALQRVGLVDADGLVPILYNSDYVINRFGENWRVSSSLGDRLRRWNTLQDVANMIITELRSMVAITVDPDAVAAVNEISGLRISRPTDPDSVAVVNVNVNEIETVLTATDVLIGHPSIFTQSAAQAQSRHHAFRLLWHGANAHRALDDHVRRYRRTVRRCGVGMVQTPDCVCACHADIQLGHRPLTCAERVQTYPEPS